MLYTQDKVQLKKKRCIVKIIGVHTIKIVGYCFEYYDVCKHNMDFNETDVLAKHDILQIQHFFSTVKKLQILMRLKL